MEGGAVPGAGRDDLAAAGLASAAGFDAAFAAVEHSGSFRRIWREVYGADYPEEAAPFSFVTITDLHAIAEAVGVRAGGRLLDLACGAGGPGLWVAEKTGADLVGIDFSPVAIAQARAHAERQGLREGHGLRSRTRRTPGCPAPGWMRP
jgi:2-polyprenyl-3-methyl-5-hydroxy-6-metoxy-1,4-benzoquinol methylase